MRPKSTHQDLPPRMVARERARKDGSLWVGYYYNGRDESGKRKEFALGTDLIEAKRKWAELEAKPVPPEAGIMRVVFDRYEREVLPGKAPQTQRGNLKELANLRKIFSSAPIDQIKPMHIAQYRDNRDAKVRANRELALLSHIFNAAREWGYTDKENPCKGVKKNKESPRELYASAAIWDAVYAAAAPELQSAMRLAYLTGQRTADVLKMQRTDLIDDELQVGQNKTGRRLRISLTVGGLRTELGLLIDALLDNNAGKIVSLKLLRLPDGRALTVNMLRNRFDAARQQAVASVGDAALAGKIRAFQFRDIRAKAASEIADIAQASQLLGHTAQKITADVYRRAGQKVNPTR